MVTELLSENEEELSSFIDDGVLKQVTDVLNMFNSKN